MKNCGKCGEDKSLEMFSRRGRIRQSWCKPCVRVYDSERFQRIKPLRMKQDRDWSKSIMEKVRLYKAENPCSDCGGYFHPVAMQFDHLPGNVKIDGVANLLTRGWGYERILTEIVKCDLVCANCHSVRTFERREAGSGALVA